MASDSALFITTFSLLTTIAFGMFVDAPLSRIERHRRQSEAIYGTRIVPTNYGEAPSSYQPVSHTSYGPEWRRRQSVHSFSTQQQLEPYLRQDGDSSQLSQLGNVQAAAIRPIQSTIETREQPPNFATSQAQQIYPPISAEDALRSSYPQSHNIQSPPLSPIFGNPVQPIVFQPGFSHRVKVTRVGDAPFPPTHYNPYEPGLLASTSEPNYSIGPPLECCINGQGPCCRQEEINRFNSYQSALANTTEFNQPLNRGFTGSGAAFVGNIAESYPNDPNSGTYGYRESTTGSYLPTSTVNYPAFPPGIPDRPTIQVGVGTPGFWAEWSPWSSCAQQTRSRTRFCDYGHNALANGCLGKAYESIPCVGDGLIEAGNVLATPSSPITPNGGDSLLGSQASPPAFYSRDARGVPGYGPIQPVVRTYRGADAALPLGDLRKNAKIVS